MHPAPLLKIFFLILCYENADGRSQRIRRIVGGLEADVAPYDDPVTYVRYAGRSAKVVGVLEKPHYSFRGIRYAESPTGVNRFQRPRKYILDGDYNATEHPPPCLQPIPDTDQVTGKEDCLFLNVYTPKLPEGDEGLPVLLWIHGGGFRYGSASQYGAKYLMQKKVVLVTIQYRLGSLGFLSSGTADYPGNVALFDMATAIEWTENYIPFFGGNAKKITVMGHGTGASCASILALSKIAKNIPSAIIAMSGTAISNWAIDKTPSNTAREVAEYQGCPTDDAVKMIKCLQKADADSIIKGDSHIETTRLEKRGFLSGLSGLLGSCPTTEGANDGRSLPAAVQHAPIDDLSQGRKPNIPLLTGVTRDETKKAVNDQYKDEIISNLESIPDFLDNVLIKNLQSLIGLTPSEGDQSDSLWSVLDPLQFKSYVEMAKDNVVDGLSKISEATADALFNLPAFLSADLWSRNNTSAYLYRFQHYGKAPKGNAFLRGLPLVSENDKVDVNETISHGDDLSYIFEAHTLDGSTIEETKTVTEEDEKVRDLFTQIIADFARDGKIRVNNQFMPTFTGKANNFVEISAEPKISDQFRFCEMALWAGMVDRLKTVTCEAKNTLLNVVTDPLQNIPNVLNPEIVLPYPGVPFGSSGSRKTGWLG